MLVFALEVVFVAGSAALQTTSSFEHLRKRDVKEDSRKVRDPE